MSAEPQKFFVGLVDFFAVLLPGAVLVYLLADDVGPRLIGTPRYRGMPETERWAVFLVASYLVGHIVFLLGSWLDELYDLARRATMNAQIERLAHDGRLLPWWRRLITWLIFKREGDRAVDAAGRLKGHALAPLRAAGAINTFQWSKAVLGIQRPEHLVAVERFEASSKFFRCLVVVLLALAAVWAATRRWPLAAGALAITPLAFWRFMDQRFKATNHAYWYVIAAAGHAGLALPPPPPRAAGAATHAGGVVYRGAPDDVEYLLVTAAREPSQWVLPKGRVEPGEHLRETAVREVREEAGVWARIVGELPAMAWPADGATVTAAMYLMEALTAGRPIDRRRRRAWLPLDDALARATYLETRDLLQRAEHQRLRTREPHGSHHPAC